MRAGSRQKSMFVILLSILVASVPGLGLFSNPPTVMFPGRGIAAPGSGLGKFARWEGPLMHPADNSFTLLHHPTPSPYPSTHLLIHPPTSLERAFNPPIKPIHLPLSRQRHQGDFSLVARLEADGGTGGDVEAHASGLVAVELEGVIHFKKVEVRAYLDRAIAAVGDGEGDGRFSGVSVQCRLLRAGVLRESWFSSEVSNEILTLLVQGPFHQG